MRWLRRSLISLLALGTLVVAAAAVLLWLIGTQAGTDLLFGRLRARTEPALTIERATGSLLGGLVLEDVRLRLARDELDLARLEVEWDTVAALAGVVGFSSARVSRVDYRRLPAGTTTERAAVLDLPFEIRIDGAVAEGLRLQSGVDVLEFGATRFGARFRDGLLELDDVTTESNGVALSGRGSVRLTSPVQLRAALAWSGPVGDAGASGSLRVDGDWPVLRVHHELTTPFTAVAEGELRFGAEPRADLRVEWQGLVLPGLDRYSSPRGQLALAGTVADYRYDGNGTLNLGGRLAAFTIEGTGEAALLHVASLVLDAQTWDGEPLGELSGSGDVTLDARTADLAVAARDLDPRWLVDGWPGRMTGTAALAATVSPLEARFTAIDLAGELRGYALTMRGAVTRAAPSLWQFAPLRLESPMNLVVLDGSVDGSTLALDVDADVAQLGLLAPGVSGGLTADLRLDGSFSAPQANGLVEARALRVGDYAAQRVKLQGEGGLAAGTRLDLTLEADGIARGSLRADALRARLTGTTTAHRITAQVGTSDWLAQADASGGLEAHVWRGSIERLDINEMLLGDWKLAEPAAVSLAAGSATLAPSCLVHESGARGCAELALAGQPEDKLVLSAQNVELATLKPLLPPALAVEGVYQLSASLFDLTGSPRGALSVQGGPTQARVVFGAAQAFPMLLDEVTAGGTLSEGRLELTANVRSGETGRVTIGGRIDDVRASDSTIGGNVGVHWPDLAFLALLSPELGQVGGTLDMDLTIGGTVESPTVDGRAAWNDGRIAVPAWGLVIEQIRANATSPDGRALAFDATGKVGDGTLELTGSTALDPQAGWPTRLKLRGESVPAVQLAEAEIYATPDLDVFAELPDIRVTGTVHVPRAAIELSALPEQAVTPSPDTVLHGETAVTEVRPLRLATDVLLTLGDDVRYSGLNLATDVTGQLRLNADPGRSATATGTLTLDGTYNAYGQTLQLERGELLFSGPLDDPGLAVRAVREIESTTGAEAVRVGVELTGTVKAPRTRVFSTPSMSEADALSYLLLGRPVTGSGSQETATLQTAAISMGLNQALPAVQRVGRTLRLDELSVQTTDTDAGALMAGKYLSPRVYIRYSYGLFNRIGGLLVRFKLSERLSLETRSGDQKSMDLLYTVEKD